MKGASACSILVVAGMSVAADLLDGSHIATSHPIVTIAPLFTSCCT